MKPLGSTIIGVMDVPSDDRAGLRLRATIQVSNDIGRHTEVVLHVRCHGTLTCTILQAYQVKAWIEIEDCDDFDNDDNLCRYTYSKDWTGAPQDPLTFKFPESCSSKVQSQLSQIELRGCVPHLPHAVSKCRRPTMANPASCSSPDPDFCLQTDCTGPLNELKWGPQVLGEAMVVSFPLVS